MLIVLKVLHCSRLSSLCRSSSSLGSHRRLATRGWTKASTRLEFNLSCGVLRQIVFLLYLSWSCLWCVFYYNTYTVFWRPLLLHTPPNRLYKSLQPLCSSFCTSWCFYINCNYDIVCSLAMHRTHLIITHACFPTVFYQLPFPKPSCYVISTWCLCRPYIFATIMDVSSLFDDTGPMTL